MDKFLFVTCVKDEEMYGKCLIHLRRLHIPENSAVEFFPIRGATSMTAGYNQALKHDAKYKIYLHEDTLILNKMFLHDIVTLFQSRPDIGMLGLIGCKKLPPQNYWWKGKELFGKILAYRVQIYDLLKYTEVEDAVEVVEAIDGVLMATQYDVPWREDIIPGFHLYDVSQSLEFIKRGYQVAIPKQIEPWAFHARTTQFNQVEYEKHLNNFLVHYGSKNE